MERRVLLSAPINSISLPGEYVRGKTPQSQLVMDAQGNLYGTTTDGGSAGLGTVFEIPDGTNTITTLVNFNGIDGATPMAGVTLDSSGDIFGTTSGGGANNSGTLFEIAHGTTTLTTLVTFDDAGTIDGAYIVGPTFAPLLDSNGDIFGYTPGDNDTEDDPGAVIEIVHGTNAVSVLATFPSYVPGPIGGEYPVIGGIAIDSSGNVFGVASSADGNSDQLFKISHGTTTATILATVPQGSALNPGTGVVLDSADDLFGTTMYDATNNTGGYDDGIVFELHHGASSITLRGTFTGSNGSTPNGGLQLDSNGDLFGTTQAGGANSDGVVFKIAAGTNTITDLASFNSTNGAMPEAGMIFDSAGDLFGTTANGGSNNQGAVFEIASGQTAISTLASFDNSNNPNGGPLNSLLEFDGNLYGSTADTYGSGGGANGDGAVIEIPDSLSSVTDLADFDATTGSEPSGLLADASGDLFCTTSEGIFEIVHGTSTIKALYELNPDIESGPGNLVVDAEGNLFGTIQNYDGVDSNGNAIVGSLVFELPNGATTINVVESGTIGTLSVAPNGVIYGTTAAGSSNDGTIFKIVNGVASTVVTFDLGGTNGDTEYAPAGLVFDSAGDIFGTTLGGGITYINSSNVSQGYGTVFEIPAGSSTLNTLVEFDGTDGQNPGSLAIDAAGDLFGTTGSFNGNEYQYETTNVGTVFEIPHGTTTLTTLTTFDGENGAGPVAVTIDPDGDLYALTQGGGTNGAGTILEYPAITTPLQVSTVSLSASTNPAMAGGSVAFTATVASATPSETAPTGTGVFFQDGNQIGAAAVQSDGRASFTLNNLIPGSYQITALYDGDNDYASSNSSPLTFAVNPLTTTTALSVAINPQVAGQSVQVTAAIAVVSGGSSMPTGTVNLYQNGTLLQSGLVQSNGQKTFTLTNLQAGSYQLTANYIGDANDGASTSSAVTFVVTPLSTATPSLASVKLPAVVVGGQKLNIHVPVVITNSGSNLNGKFTVNLYANLSPSLDGNETLLKDFSEKLSLKQGGPKTVQMTVGSLPTVPGIYYLLAEVTDSTGAQSVAASSTTIQVSAPMVAFSETPVQSNLAPSAFSDYKTSASAQFEIENTGNIASKGEGQISLYLSTDAIGADDVLIRTVNLPIALKPAAKREISVALLRLPVISYGSYYLVALVTQSDAPVSQSASASQYTLTAASAAFLPTGGSIANGSGGSAVVSFKVLNEGNVPLAGLSTVILYTSPDGTTTDETQLLSKRESLSLLSGMTRVLKLHLTTAQFSKAVAAGTLIIEIIGPAPQTLPPQSLAVAIG